MVKIYNENELVCDQSLRDLLPTNDLH